MIKSDSERLQALYDGEINFAVMTDWDLGFYASVGPRGAMGRPQANFSTFKATVDWICAEALRRYPTSLYAKAQKPHGH